VVVVDEPLDKRRVVFRDRGKDRRFLIRGVVVKEAEDAPRGDRSGELMLEVGEAMQPFFADLGVACLIQGTGTPRSLMLEKFKADRDSALKRALHDAPR